MREEIRRDLEYEEAQAWKEWSISLSLQGTALSASQHGEDGLLDPAQRPEDGQ